MAENVEIMGSDGTTAIKVKVDSSGNVQTTANGGVASGAADSGNPVKVGGVYSSTKPTLTNGQRGDLQIGTRGSLGVQVMGADSANQAAVSSPNESTATQVGLWVDSQSLGYHDSSGWDRWRNNNNITVLSSAARTATTNSSDLTNYNGRGLHLVIDVTAIAATPSVVFTIQGKDALSSQYYTILASAAITGTGTTVLRVFPAATAAANTIANDILPRTWRINAVHADADSITYSVGASVIL